MSDKKASPQPGILKAVPRASRYIAMSILDDRRVAGVLALLSKQVDGDAVVMGLGARLVAQLDARIDGLRGFPRLRSTVKIPATASALWFWIRGEDAGAVLHCSRRLEAIADGVFRIDTVVDGFRHGEGRDLTGYIDGTENPKGAKAKRAAFVAGQGAGLDDSSFVAVQQWLHDFRQFDAMTTSEQDHAIGRRRRDDVELASAPVSAHVKRTAQEDFDPEAFVLRRSMPWINGQKAGLMFVAFGASLDAFEAQLRRMAGMDDNIVDALFRFTRPLTGAYYWCPPMKGGTLDLSRVLPR